ncbi:MAG: hypothetical protein PGN25_14020 [Methylorubrum populi]
MAHGSYHDGPALLALKSSVGRPVPLSPEAVVAAERPRDRIWELTETLHCSIIGTCLTTADGRSLLAKLGVAAARTMSEHRLHGEVVHLARRKDGGGKLLQKMLDRRHEREIRRFDKARTVDEVRALWRESDAKGSPVGADLTSGRWLWSDGSLAGIERTIANGVPEPKEHGGAMPPMDGVALSEPDLKAVAAYVWAVGHSSALADPATRPSRNVTAVSKIP